MACRRRAVRRRWRLGRRLPDHAQNPNPQHLTISLTNWVKACDDCDPQRLFGELRKRVNADVEEYNRLGLDADSLCQVESGRTAVVRGDLRVHFELNGNCIRARAAKGRERVESHVVEVTPRIGTRGVLANAMLRRDDIDVWEFSWWALQRLFFGQKFDSNFRLSE